LSLQKAGYKGHPQKVTSNLQVYGNNMTVLTACQAQILVGKGAHEWEFYGNQYGKLLPTAYSVAEPNLALLFCDGCNNKFFEDFSGCDVATIPGWDTKNPGASVTDGPGRVKLDANSNGNEVFVDYLTFAGTTPGKMQVWDVNNENAVALGLWFIPDKPPRPRVGRPEWPRPPELVRMFSNVERLRVGVFGKADERGVIFGELRSSPSPRTHVE
jgi:hypothetical protein